ncbi:MAG: ATP-dependent DNA helicase, partial [Patescibacteria group bacterium]
LLDDYHEGQAMYRILTLPLWKTSHQDITELSYFAKRKGYSLYEAMRQGDALKIKGKETVKKILSLLERHQQLVREKKNTSEIVQSFLQDSGYLKELTKEESLSNQAELNYLNQFYKKITSFEKENPDKTLNNFLSFVDLELESGEEGSLEQNLEEGPDTVKILTIHTAKGLEFKYVFVANLVDKKFPSISKSDAIEIPAKLVKEIMPEGDVHLQEERRLFYVAMTRAKEGLFLTSADDYGGLRKKKLSRFLMELSEKGFKLAQTDDKEIELSRPKEKEKKIAYPAPKSFSFTQLTAYNNCPYQYRFAHVLHVPVRGKPSFSFGKTMHSTLQNFFLLVKSREENKQGDLFGKGEVKDPAW